MRLPRRRDQSAQRTTFAPESSSRDAIAGAAKPEKIGTCTAPTCAHACDATATAGHIGMKIATRSPGPTPSSTSASASCVTARDASAQLSASRRPSSLCQTSASSSGRSAAQRWTQTRATLTRPPTNHVAHSGPRETSTTASHGRENSMPRSSTTAGQNRSGSSTEIRCSSW